MSQHQAMPEENVMLGSFFLGEEEFALELLSIREIIRIIPMTKVPCADQFVEGTVNLRGEVIPVINLRTLFNMQPKPLDADARIMNVEVHGKVVGFIVDRVGNVRRMPVADIKPTPAVATPIRTEYISGMAIADEHLLLILDADKMLAPETLRVLE